MIETNIKPTAKNGTSKNNIYKNSGGTEPRTFPLYSYWRIVTMVTTHNEYWLNYIAWKATLLFKAKPIYFIIIIIIKDYPYYFSYLLL